MGLDLTVTLGNVVTIATMLIGGIAFIVDIRSNVKSNRALAQQACEKADEVAEETATKIAVLRADYDLFKETVLRDYVRASGVESLRQDIRHLVDRVDRVLSERARIGPA